MTDKQIIIDENKINPNDWLEPYKPIPACEIKDCDHLVYAGNNIYGCRIAEDGLVCDDFNNDDECCMYRQLEYYKEALKAKEQECERLNNIINEAKNSKLDLKSFLVGEAVQNEYEEQLDQLKEQLEAYKMEAEEGKEINAELKADNKHLNDLLNQALKELEQSREAIEKIKEIAKEHVPRCDIPSYECNYECDCEMCHYRDLSQILQICDEVNDV